MQNINIEKIQSEVTKLAKQYHFSLVVMFGSQVSKKIHPQSDVDLGFLAKERLGLKDVAKIQYEFSQRLKIKNLEMHDLGNAPPLLLKNIATKSILLYEEENSLYDRFKIYGIKIYLETNNLLKLREAALNKFLEKT